ncbi:metalloproteinase, extracellular matrix glycoprotein VMP2 [Volvox carteri f. nagariensis]|uniref:Metalloproteinase, extracellular matrix glycoprotein VMP2 n=1 Tax=Volvox carteri f. nagariensis TaxID=3068 RepID=Q948Y8_VOLCA|nr:metalloproteinase, extracellular matrix glycoprotein VMP2 [Volvox carteri f. nagariensis]EFJ40265.1 metalloproteinase, extracellular matrix glycoprotein VMP2 [Volvox carteri f. nagariensis]CAC39317.1 VMP2 protein [Volvox carteri f. nagariensis]|eukprot:XP_002958662.1 metalloproteinase, extracellular matrix glycoprotein VMP2 [Volvox carteri f. nagariensis]
MMYPYVLLFALLSLAAVEGATLLPGKPNRGPPPPSPDVAPGETIDLEGQLTLVNTHDGRERYALMDYNGVLTPFSADFVLPAADKDNNRIETGAVVGMQCVVGPPKYCGCGDVGANCTCPDDASTTACVSAPQAAISLLMSASQALAFGPSSTGSQQKLLVMILDYSACGLAPSLTESQVRKIFLGPDEDGLGGVAKKYSQCSYYKFGLNVTAFTAVRISLNCSSTVIDSCSWWTISQRADDAAKLKLGLTAFATFTHFTYVLPPGLQRSCPWAGLALLPGRQTWLQSSSYGIQRWATVMQEAIHNYGLWHSWRNGWEYEDYSTAMGRGDACPNAAETSRLGWATPADGGDAINSGVLADVGTVRSWPLPATYLTGEGNYLRVLPDWLPTDTGAKNLYIDLRVNKEGDAALGSDYANKVHVHEVNATMDNGYPSSYTYSDRRIEFIGGVDPSSRAVYSAYKLVIYASPISASDTIMVYLCRYDTVDGQCPSLDDALGASSSPPSSPQTPSSPQPPPPKSPPPKPPPPTKPPPKSPPPSRMPPPWRSPPPPRTSPPPPWRSPPHRRRQPPPRKVSACMLRLDDQLQGVR